MRFKRICVILLSACLLISPLSAYSKSRSGKSALPQFISPPGEKVIIVDPNVHAFGAYNADGKLLRTGLVTAGGRWCPDIHRSCRTRSGTFRIYSLGSGGCKSSKYPLPRGGAPMPYCMFFNKNQALHGSYNVVYGNVSHGCVRLHVGDAKWLRFNFVEGPNSVNGYRGTKVVVRAY